MSTYQRSHVGKMNEHSPLLTSGPPLAPGDDDWPALHERPSQPFDLWTQANLGESLPRPLSPLTWSALPYLINHSFRAMIGAIDKPYLDEIPWVGRFYGRTYGNEGAVAHVMEREFGLPGSFLDRAFGGRSQVPAEQGSKFRPWRMARSLPLLIRQMASAGKTQQTIDALLRDVDEQAEAFLKAPMEAASDRQLWVECSRWLERASSVLSAGAQQAAQSFMIFAILEKLLARWCDRPEWAHALLAGLPDLYSVEIGRTLWDLSCQAHALGLAPVLQNSNPVEALARLGEMPEAEPFLDALQAFLTRHGHRCPNEFEWMHPRWVETPEQVIASLSGYLQLGEESNPNETARRQRQSRQETIAWLDKHLNPVRRTILRRSLTSAQNIVRTRDNYRHTYTKTLFALRRIVLELGRRWSGTGWLDSPEDVFFLTLPDMEQVIDKGEPVSAGKALKALVSGRRLAYKYWCSVDAPEVLGPGGLPINKPAEVRPEALVLQGLAASPGQVRGRACILHDPHEASQLRPGEILVTRATDPGWTVVFPIIGGLVLEVGGQLSHGAIVAREMGLPAVVGVRDATRMIQHGEMLFVDGTAGRVHKEAI